MKTKRLLLISLGTFLLTLSGCSKSSEPTKDTTPTSTDTGSSEDINTDTSSNTDTSTDTSDTTSSDSSTDPIPETYSITVIADEHITYEFLGINLDAVLPETAISFMVTPNDGYQIVSVKLDNDTLTGSGDTYTFSMPNKNVTITISSEEIPAPTTYFVVGRNTGNVNFNLIDKGDPGFVEGETVAFTCSAKEGYVIKNFEITRDDTNAPISYTGTSYFEFAMPNSNVSITFDVAQTYKISTSASAHTKITVDPDKYLYEANTEISVTVEVTDEKYQLDSVSVIAANGQTVSTTLDGATYKFMMPASNVTILTTESEKPVEESNDPFTSLTTFEGSWSYYDGYTDYTMHFRVVFNGDKTLNWYLTYEYIEDEWGDYWTYDDNNINGPVRQYATVYSKPSDMVGDLKAGETGVAYTYDETADQIKYNPTVKTSTVACTLQINRTAGNIKTIKMLNDMSGDYYQSKDCTLSKK